MRPIFIIVVLIILSTAVKAQLVSIGLKGFKSGNSYGDNFETYYQFHHKMKADAFNAQITTYYDNNPHYAIGGFVNYKLSNYLFLQTELIYMDFTMTYRNSLIKNNQPGVKHPQFVDNYLFKYITIPFKVKKCFRIKRGGVEFYVGPDLNFKLKGRHVYSFDTTGITDEDRSIVENGKYLLQNYSEKIDARKCYLGLSLGVDVFYQINKYIIIQGEAGLSRGITQTAIIYSNELKKNYYIRHNHWYLSLGVGYIIQ